MTMTRAFVGAALLLGAFVLSACVGTGQVSRSDPLFAPGIDTRAEAEDGLTVGHRLVNAGEYELALRAFTRAALDRGETDAEILLGMGTANLGLGRLGQAEDIFRLAIEKQSAWPELYNNLGVVLMERGETVEAAQVFRKAYALDNGQSDEIRDNLRLALSKSENPDTLDGQDNEYKLVRRGAGAYRIRQTP